MLVAQFGCFTSINSQPKIGAKLVDTSILKYDKHQLIQVSHAQTRWVYPFKESGVDYLVGINKDSTISYLPTFDKKFRTVNKYKIGFRYLDIDPTDVESKYVEPGIGKVVVLVSGWSFFQLAGNSVSITYFFKKEKREL